MHTISWDQIFLQSRANAGRYTGDELPAQKWDWPRDTWFRARLDIVRAQRRQTPDKRPQTAVSRHGTEERNFRYSAEVDNSSRVEETTIDNAGLEFGSKREPLWMKL
jgi:hypothetical protein